MDWRDWVDRLMWLVGEHGEDLLWWQMTARAVIVFFVGLILLRMGGKRVRGKWGAVDLMMFIVIGSNLSRTLTGNAPLVETVVATATLFLLHSLLTSAAVRWEALGPLLKGRPAQFMADGKLDKRVMRKHGVGQGDLEAALRISGRRSLEEVEEAWIERNGEISIIAR